MTPVPTNNHSSSGVRHSNSGGVHVPAPTAPSHEYDLEPGSRSEVAPTAPPPPAYDEVMEDQAAYRPLTDSEPPPPSYDTVSPHAV